MHYMTRYNLGSYWLDEYEDVCLKAMERKQRKIIVSDMLVTEWTIGYCAVAVWPSEKSAGFGSVFVRKLRVLVRFCLTIFSIRPTYRD